MANIPTISQDVLNGIQVGGAAAEGKQSTFAVGHIGRRNGDRMGQALGIDRNVALDSRYLLAGIVALLASTIRVLDTLRVDDQKARRGFAPRFCTLMQRLLELALANTELAKASAATIRVKLLKIGAAVVRNTRRIRILLTSHHPLRGAYFMAANALASP